MTRRGHARQNCYNRQNRHVIQPRENRAVPANPPEFMIAVARQYPAAYAPRLIVPIDSRQSFSNAVIYRVETAMGDFALRGWPPNAFPRAQIRGLHTLFEFISSRNVAAVAVPVRTTSGDTIWPFGERDWHLEPWKPGAANFLAEPHSEKLCSAMTALAAWHRAAAEWRSPPECAEWFASSPAGASSAIAERMRRFEYWSGPALGQVRHAVARSDSSEWKQIADRLLRQFDRLAAVLPPELKHAAAKRYLLQPCLRDVWADHVLFSGNDVTGLIDPTACRSDNVAVDLARLLGSMLGDDRQGWDDALRTYHRCRPLNADERELVGVLDRSNVVLSALTWIDRYFLKRAAIRHPDAALKRLTTYAERIDHLAASSGWGVQKLE